MTVMLFAQTVLYRIDMKEIFEYLEANYSGAQALLRVQQQELWFDFESIQIIVEFSNLDEDDFEESYIDISEVDFTILETKKIRRIFIQKSNSLYEESEGDTKKEYLDYYEPLTYQMYEFVNQIKQIFPDSIDNWSIKPFCLDDNCWSYGCPESWGYGFQINISKDFWSNRDFFDYVINNVDKNILDLPLPHFYNTSKELKDSFDLKILNSNTKIRRLGYLKILLKMMREQFKVPVSKMNKKFEIYCQDYECFLKQHKNQKGDIRITKTGNSANPYIELAGSLGLIRKSAGAYEVGKVGKVYNILIEEIDESDTNPFVLSRFDTVFFLELLLKEDYWFLYAILEQSAIQPNVSYKNLKKDFKQILLAQIKQFMDEAQADNSKKVLPLKIVERRINDWKKSEVYMEHVLMPRLNWLYDMDFIYLKNDLSFQLTEMGNRLLFNLSIWNDISLHKIVSPTAYIDSYFMKMIDFVFNFQKQRYTKEADDKFTKCLEDSFLLFKTLAPNRITFSLFANYTKQMLFWNHSVMVDTEDIKKAFELKRIPNYIYKYQEHYKDGYIQKNK